MSDPKKPTQEELPPMADLERMLGIDAPRDVVPDDETPTSPDLLVCRTCSGKDRKCKKCGGTGAES